MITFIKDITFANPGLLWLLLLLPVLIIWRIFTSSKQQAEIKLSSFKNLQGAPKTLRARLIPLLFILRLLAIGLLVIVLARPQSRSSWKDITSEGIDIIISMDVSASMLAQDFKPNRLDAAKEVAMDFIDLRPNDRIGLVIFSGESFTQCPLTSDHPVIKNLFSSVRSGMVADGTAIGEGLATAVGRIKDSKAKSKVIILLTDGVNNAGSVAPLTASEIANTFEVRVYTIGVGTKGKALSPVAVYPNGQYEYDYVDVKIDEEMMEKIAESTGGKYFRALNKEGLKNIYGEIDRLEKTKFEERSFTNKAEKFLPFAIAAGVLLLLEILLRNTLLRTIP